MATGQGAERGHRIAMAPFTVVMLIGLLLGMAQCAIDNGNRQKCAKLVDRETNFRGGSRPAFSLQTLNLGCQSTPCLLEFEKAEAN